MFLPVVPPTLPHGSGTTLQIDNSRLLIINSDFAKHVDPSILLQPSEQLILEDGLKQSGVGIDIEAPASSQPQQKLNNTRWQVWVKRSNGAPFDENTARILDSTLRSTLNWTNSVFSPVYRFPNTTGPAGLLSPLPHLLVVKAPVDKKAELIDTLLKYMLVEAPISKYFVGGFFCFVLTNPRGRNVYDLPLLLEQKEPLLVKHAWFDYVPAVVSSASFTPTDPLFAREQWNLENILAADGWNLPPTPTLGKHVVVAVIDSGCDLTHPDFSPNGFASNGTTLTYGQMAGDGSFEPGESHGTKCAGIIGARCNGKGLAGIAPDCQILPIRIATLEPSALIAAIGYAIENNAKVVSLSIEPSSGYDVPALKARIEEAFVTDNVVLCAAAGNSDVPQLFQPAAHPMVMACGASDQEDKRVKKDSNRSIFWGSNYNADPNLSQDRLSGGYLSVMAPGIEIPTTSNQGAGNWTDPGDLAPNYSLGFGGTSASTPHVAALAALLLSRDPSLTSQRVRDIIEQTADRVPTPNNFKNDPSRPNGPWWQEMGYGRINVLKALDSL